MLAALLPGAGSLRLQPQLRCPPSPPGLSWPSSSLAAFPPILCFRLTDVSDFCYKDSICIFILVLLAAFDRFSRGQGGKSHLSVAILQRSLSVNPKYVLKYRHRITGRSLTHEHLSAEGAGRAAPVLSWERGGGGFSSLGLRLREKASSPSSFVGIKCSCSGV